MEKAEEVLGERKSCVNSIMCYISSSIFYCDVYLYVRVCEYNTSCIQCVVIMVCWIVFAICRYMQVEVVIRCEIG